MAINKNHEFEDLNGIKCSIVEKNCTIERVNFLKELLEWNNYTVVVVDSPAPKTTPAAAANPAAAATPAITTASNSTDEAATVSVLPQEEIPPISLPPTTYTLGVTDLTFNSINAIFGRILKTKDNRIVTQGYWKQEVKESNDEIPYFELNKI